jgi:predicted glycosyltransferase
MDFAAAKFDTVDAVRVIEERYGVANIRRDRGLCEALVESVREASFTLIDGFVTIKVPALRMSYYE